MLYQINNIIFNLAIGITSCIIFILIFIFINVNYNFGQDKLVGIQKFHTKSTSRLGGLAIWLSLCLTFISIKLNDQNQINKQLFIYLLYFLISALPVFLGGLLEDITHKVKPRFRLLLASISALLVFIFLNFQIDRTDVIIVDFLLSIPELKFLITILVVAGFTHAVNIVDGLNGLASGLLLIIITGLSWLAWQHEDILIFELCLINFSILIVFFVFNWPFGKIFLGDGGSYLLGFIVVELGILLVYRNTQISPMAPVVLGLIPLIETLFTIYRRYFIHKVTINNADALHLHSLLYRRIVLKKYTSINNVDKQKANSVTSAIFLAPALVLMLLTCFYYSSTYVLLFIILTYLILYIYVYKRIVLFETFKILNYLNNIFD